MNRTIQILALSTALVAAIAVSDAYSASRIKCFNSVIKPYYTCIRDRSEGNVWTVNPTGPVAEQPTDPDQPSKPSRPDKPSKPSKPDKPSRDNRDKDHGNASANNGKGGNYDRTGHHDNGRGNGRNHK